VDKAKKLSVVKKAGAKDAMLFTRAVMDYCKTKKPVPTDGILVMTLALLNQLVCEMV